MSKIKQISIPLDDALDVILDNTSNWKLVRERDGLTHYAHKISWIEWGKLDNAIKGHDEPAIGRSLILDPHRLSYTWLTTSVAEIIEQKEKYIKFKTSNSVYELFKLN
jgi:hypothetical protein